MCHNLGEDKVYLYTSSLLYSYSFCFFPLSVFFFFFNLPRSWLLTFNHTIGVWCPEAFFFYWIFIQHLPTFLKHSWTLMVHSPDTYRFLLLIQNTCPLTSACLTYSYLYLQPSSKVTLASLGQLHPDRDGSIWEFTTFHRQLVDKDWLMAGLKVDLP